VERIALVGLVGVRKVEMVHQFAVEPQVNFLFVPFHRPDVKFLRPRIAAEFGDRFLDGRPFYFSIKAAADVGQNFAGVKFHYVNLPARGPADVRDVRAQRPERRPASQPCVNARAHLELSIFELAQPARRDAGGRVINPLAARLPIRAIRDEAGTAFMLLPRLDDEQPVRATGIFRLIPLQFVIAHEAVLVIPVRRIGWAVRVKLIVPDQFPIVR